MKVNLEFVELHTPLFIDGTNFGLKLYADAKKSGKGKVELWYDTVLLKYFVIYRNKLAMLDTVASSTLAYPAQVGEMLTVAVVSKATDDGVNYEPQTQVKAQVSGPGIGLKHSAQVSTPMDKVQGKPGRKAKYQGEESQGE